MSKTYYYHQDPGHGWIAVKRKELERLGILDKISGFSYQNGDTVYLEEDCDATTFCNAKKEAGEEFELKRSYREYTPIRHYEPFTN